MEKMWKTYTLIITESLLAFYIATFTLTVYLYHRDSTSDFSTGITILMGILFTFVLFAAIKRLVNQLPLAVMMILIPIAPLFALIVVVTMIPMMQLL